MLLGSSEHLNLLAFSSGLCTIAVHSSQTMLASREVAIAPDADEPGLAATAKRKICYTLRARRLSLCCHLGYRI